MLLNQTVKTKDPKDKEIPPESHAERNKRLTTEERDFCLNNCPNNLPHRTEVQSQTLLGGPPLAPTQDCLNVFIFGSLFQL